MQCDIVSAHRTVYSGEASLIVAPGAAGELGITPRHAPLMTTLLPGAVRVIEPDGKEVPVLIGGGIIEVMPHMVTVLADTAARATEFDEKAARQARDRAQRVIDGTGGAGEGMDIAEAKIMLKDTIEQLQALERWRKQVQHRK